MELTESRLIPAPGKLKGVIITQPVWPGLKPALKERFIKQMKDALVKTADDPLLITPENPLPEFSDYPVKNSELRILLSAVKELKPEPGDMFLILPGYSPYLDARLTRDLISHHRKFLADYTFSENIPPGFTGDLITAEMAEMLTASALKDNETRTIREYLTAHMNEYDVEIFYELPDMRQYRLDFTLNTSRSCALSGRFAELPLSYEILSQLIHKNPYLIRPSVSWLEAELTNFSKVNPVFIPRLKKWSHTAEYLNQEHLNEIYSWIQEHALDDDLSVCLGGTGDSFYHPQLLEILKNLFSEPKIKRVYLETFGIDLDDDACERISRIPGAGKLHIIIRLNSLKPERWAEFHESDLFPKVKENLDYLKKADTVFHLHAEMLRMKENADEINEFFEFFKDSKINVIISKYNRYINKLPERRLSDLTPLHRDFCWHLARDICITSSGKIPVCRQDPFAEGDEVTDLLKDGIQAAFLKLENYHSHSVRGDHHSVPMDCLKCDEWYTFNG